MSEEADEQLPSKDDLDARSKELWHLAAKHVVPWDEDKLRRDDYDFGSWAKDARNDENADLLNAGCAYEYTRESHMLRCKLVLLELKRKRELSGIIVLRTSEQPGWWGWYLFESGWEEWLRTFTFELASNKSFAELLRTSPAKVKESLEAIDGYSLFPKAVQSPGRHVEYPGSGIIPVQFFWRNYNNDEIGEEMKLLAKKLRPAEEPEPMRVGKGKKSEIKSLLGALSVMRIWKLHERNPWKRLKLVAEVCRYRGCVKEAEAYKERCKDGRGEEPMSNPAKKKMSEKRTQALRFFQSLFEGETPSNY